jgi:putative DNA primase/helicase
MKIEHDGHIALATARNRRTKTWLNETMLWSDFLQKLSIRHDTPETVAEYAKFNKERQDDYKDVGGYFGGRLLGGRRSNTTVTSRSMITLDIDEGAAGMWELVKSQFDYACALYSTHKHTPIKPRYRLLLPLKEEVTADEYEAIGRAIAKNVGIECFDDSTFQPARFMYWPSTSKDGEYVFEYVDAEWLDGRAFLKENYRDWTDRASWPYSNRVPVQVKTIAKKQGEPTEKPGIVGLFCRTYDIDTAIATFLPDIYRKEGKHRYTYLQGSTSGGLVVYEGGKFAFSNHSTDPACGKLCNAFDLVRIHKFGAHDDKDRNYAKPGDMPSFGMMGEMCAKDKGVSEERAKERSAEVDEDFAGVDDDIEDEKEKREKVLAGMEADKRNNYLPTMKNYVRVIEHEPLLEGKIAYDEFADHIVIMKKLPWQGTGNYKNAWWTDSDDANLRFMINNIPYKLKPSVQTVSDALSIVAHRHTFHPVRDYLKNLKWDGVKRLDTLFIDYLGAADDALIRAQTRKAFVAAVARIFRPGTKFDYVVTLIGKQGIGKSTILKKMGKEWFSDSLSTFDGKDGMEQLRSVWLIELGELSVYNKSQVEQVKTFLSKCADDYRPAYGRQVRHFERQCVFFATTNEAFFLRGDKGNRRFWPIDLDENKKTKNVFDMDDATIDQLWAEAKSYYEKGEPLNLTREQEKKANELQEAHSEEDERKGIIIDFLERRLPLSWKKKSMQERQSYFANYEDECSESGVFQRQRITTIEIINECLREPITDKTRYSTRGIAAILNKLEGWKSIGIVMNGAPYGRQRTWERIEKENDGNLKI